MVDTLAA